MTSTLFLAFFCLIPIAITIPVDNEVVGEPEIECSADHVLVNFNTRNPFEGHTYVKGHYMTDGCRQDATNSRAASISVSFDSCGVRRQRSLNPAGLFVIGTVVVSFHPQFVTKVDRAYNVKCFYMEADKTVSTDLGVSMLTTGMLTQNVPMPVCKYEVRRDDAQGEVVRYARIGDKVYHSWGCDTETVEIFCMTVHSCFVDNGQETRVQLLDENGCAQDKYLLQNVEYGSDLAGGRETHVFKFADKPTLFFNCQIRLTLKENGQCARTADNCEAPIRGKRDSPLKESHMQSANKEANIDVFSEDIIVFSDMGESVAETEEERELNEMYASGPYHRVYPRNSSNQVCLTRTSFSLLLAALCIILLCIIVSTVFCCFRNFRVMPGKEISY